MLLPSPWGLGGAPYANTQVGASFHLHDEDNIDFAFCSQSQWQVLLKGKMINVQVPNVPTAEIRKVGTSAGKVLI